MRRKHKANELAADAFDMRLYALIDSAIALRGKDGTFYTRWDRVALLLSEARPIVRAMMSEDDRKVTS